MDRKDRSTAMNDRGMVKTLFGSVHGYPQAATFHHRATVVVPANRSQLQRYAPL